MKASFNNGSFSIMCDTSQCGIDDFIFDLFDKNPGVFLETGASHPVDKSNSYVKSYILITLPGTICS